MAVVKSAGGGATSTPRLRREIGLWVAVALVLGNMIGSGVFLLPASMAGQGSVSMFGWVLTGIGAMLLALVFATLGRAHRRTGGPYAYARKAFGDFVGFQTAWGYWIAIWAGNAAITVAFVGYLSVFWPALGTNGPLAAFVGIAAIWLLTLTNVLGVRQGGAVQLVTTILKFVPLVVVGLVGLFFMRGGNFSPFAPHGVLPGLTTAAALTLWAFIGLAAGEPLAPVTTTKPTVAA